MPLPVTFYRNEREESWHRKKKCEFLWLGSFPNCLEGSKCGGHCMNEFELDNIMCVELLSASEKMLSKYTVLASKIMTQCSIYSSLLPTCQLFPRDGGRDEWARLRESALKSLIKSPPGRCRV